MGSKCRKALIKAAGTELDRLVPTEGRVAKVELNVNVPVSALNTKFIFMKMNIEAERGEKNSVKIKSDLGAGVRSAEDLWTVEIFAKAMASGIGELRG